MMADIEESMMNEQGMKSISNCNTKRK